MLTKQLQRTLFSMKRINLEKKIGSYYQDTQDTDSVVEYAITVLVRGALTTNDFSFFLYDLIRELFLHAEPSETMRKFCSFFERYFEEKEFDTVISRLFGSKNEYFKASKTARIHREYLENHGTGILDQEYDKYCLISYFEDANGKKQTWRLRDADPKNTVKETKRILKILTTLTIFQKDGIRRFAKFLDYECKGETVISSTRMEKEEKQEKPAEAVAQKTVKTSEDFESDQPVIIDGFDLNLLSKNQLLGLIKVWIEQAEDRTAEEENEADHEDMPETATAPQTSPDSGIDYDKPKNSSQKATINSSAPPVESNLTPAMSAAGEVQEENDDKRAETNVQNEQSPAKRPKKKMTKEERRLLKNFQQGKKK